MPLRYLLAVAGARLASRVNFDALNVPVTITPYDISPTDVGVFGVLCALSIYYGYAPISEGCVTAKRLDENSSKYSTEGIPAYGPLKHWIRQLYYDAAVYCIPLIGIALVFPECRNFIDFLLIFCTFYIPVYNHVVVKLFLQVSERLTTMSVLDIPDTVYDS